MSYSVLYKRLFDLFNISYFVRKFTPILQCCNEVYKRFRLQKTAIPNMTRGNLVVNLQSAGFLNLMNMDKKMLTALCEFALSIGKPH
jgi:hypothetical protein